MKSTSALKQLRKMVWFGLYYRYY